MRFRTLSVPEERRGKPSFAQVVWAAMAWAFVKYSRDYAQQEAAVKADPPGVHVQAASRPGSGARNN
jgi:hypothetical protein